MRDKEEQLKVENQKRLLADLLIQRDQEHIRFQRSVDHIEELLGETNEDKCKYASETLKKADVRLKERMDICEQIQQKYISNLESKEEKEKEKELGITIWETFNKICNKVQMFIGQHGMKLKDKAEKGGGCDDQGSSFRLEKLRFQMFDGNVRKYTRFKSEFDKYVKPICKPDQVAFILKSYLSEEIKEEVDTLGDDLKDIWDRLDKKYGDQGKLIDATMSEVNEMPFFEDDDEQGILLMINTIEEPHRDLLLLGIDSEISNSTIVSMTEQKMPKEMKREWIKIVIGEKRMEIAKDKFPSLVKLVIHFRERLEYEMSNIRGDIPHKGKVNFNEGRLQGNKPTESNKQRCWIHLTNGDHPIWRCRVFASKSPSEKVDLVRKNNACFACLEVGHVAKGCKRNFKCKEENCGLGHHQLLHEAHASGVVFHSSVSINNIWKSTDTLLQLQQIKVGRGPSRGENLNVLWDGGSTLSFITFQKQRKTNSKGKKYDYKLSK